MKDYPTIYVISSYNDGIQAAYYQKSDAEDWCRETMMDWGEPKEDWSLYFEIDEVKVG